MLVMPAYLASFVGVDKLEILELVKILEKPSVPCCVMDISALKYYDIRRL
jgi:hypothetical protein